nr:MAG TPA: hypothetical protein [Caudoviricetes sp.]
MASPTLNIVYLPFNKKKRSIVFPILLLDPVLFLC